MKKRIIIELIIGICLFAILMTMGIRLFGCNGQNKKPADSKGKMIDKMDSNSLGKAYKDETKKEEEEHKWDAVTEGARKVIPFTIMGVMGGVALLFFFPKWGIPLLVCSGAGSIASTTLAYLPKEIAYTGIVILWIITALLLVLFLIVLIRVVKGNEWFKETSPEAMAVNPIGAFKGCQNAAQGSTDTKRSWITRIVDAIRGKNK